MTNSVWPFFYPLSLLYIHGHEPARYLRIEVHILPDPDGGGNFFHGLDIGRRKGHGSVFRLETALRKLARTG